MENISKADGYLILACKQQYRVEGVDTTLALKRILSCMCGWSHDEHGEVSDKDLLNRLYDIVLKLYKDNSYKMESIQRDLHDKLVNGWYGYELKPGEVLVLHYVSVLMMSLVFDKEGRKILRLPKPKKRLFKKVVKGNYLYNEVAEEIKEG